MHLILFLIVACITQSYELMSISILAARQANISWFTIHTIWAATTLFDVVVTYVIIKHFLGEKHKAKLFKLLDKYGKKLHQFNEKHGETIALFILGPLNFIQINAALAAWTRIPFKKAGPIFYFGAFIGYLFVLSIVTGIKALIPDIRIAFVVLFLLAVLLTTLIKHTSKHLEK